MPMSLHPSLPLLIVLWAAPVWVAARVQEPVLNADGVFRVEYADVLRAEPVYPGALESRVGSNCVTSDSSHRRGGQHALVQRLAPSPPPALRGSDGNVSDVVFSADVECASVPLEANGDSLLPIAWDVDYILRGIKYRSRLPYDPGERVRVRVSVTPVLAPVEARDPP